MTDPSKWIKLDNFRCPAAGCPNREEYSWNCPEHRSPRYINALGKIGCEKGCYADFCQVAWQCPHSFHDGGNNTQSNIESVTMVLSQSIQLSSKKGWSMDNGFNDGAPKTI